LQNFGFKIHYLGYLHDDIVDYKESGYLSKPLNATDLKDDIE
jgi:hypothetical protein